MRSVPTFVLDFLRRIGHALYSFRARTRGLGAFESAVDFVRRQGGRLQTDPVETCRLTSLSVPPTGMETSLQFGTELNTCTGGQTELCLVSSTWAGFVLRDIPYRNSRGRGGFPPLERSPPKLNQLKNPIAATILGGTRWRCGRNPTARKTCGPAFILG